jgi:hypothetical protein
MPQQNTALNTHTPRYLTNQRLQELHRLGYLNQVFESLFKVFTPGH